MFEDSVHAANIGLYDDVKGNQSPLIGKSSKDKQKQGQTWDVLKRTCADYPEIVLDCLKQQLLYQGGFQMNRKEVAQLFCPKMRSEEGDEVYKERVTSASYVPTFSKLITGIISTLFSEDLSVMEASDHDDPSTAGNQFTDHLRDYYKLFEQNCDGHGQSLHNFAKEFTTKALIHQFCFFGVDFPKPDPQVQNQLQVERLGLDRPRLYKIDTSTVYDYQMKEDSDHELSWIKLVAEIPFQPTPFDKPMIKVLVKCWSLNEQGTAQYQCFLSRAVEQITDLKDKEIIPMVDEGSTSFKRIPIFYFYLDDGVAVGAKLAPMAAEHFNRSTIENHSTNKACLTVPVVFRGPMMAPNELPAPIMFDQQRGQFPKGSVNNHGVLELGSKSEDDFRIVESEGKALTFIHKQNEDLDEKMHSVVHQMGQSLKQARSQSGKTALSKQEDRRSTEMLLTAIADEVYFVVEKIFCTIAHARGEDIIWDVKGLSTISQEDRDELVQEVKLLPSLNFPSITFMKEYNYRIASRLIEGTDQRTLQTIRGEIEEALDNNPNIGISGKSLSQEADKPPKQPNSSDSISDNIPDEMSLGPAGQPLMPEGSHLQTGEHIDSQVVFDQLSQDYRDKDIEFVKYLPWIGPVEVPLSSIDFSNKDNWQASQEPQKIDQMAQKMQDGFSKPVILVNNPSNDNKMMIIDGHHRCLAALQNNTPINAYIGHVGSNHGPWEKLHSKQVGSKQESSQQKSNQINETSLQKEVSNQVNKSAAALGGKTK